jgi:hypothetical protein
MTSNGTNCSCSKPSAHMPMMKPKRLKATAVSRRKTSIQPGCAMRSGTKNHAVARMVSPRITDLVAAAPTKPTAISSPDTGAERYS